MDLPDGDLVFDGAYWVDRMDVRDESADDSNGMIDVTTDALGGREPELTDEGTTAIPAGESGSTEATVTGQHFVAGPARSVANAFEAETTNLAGVELDAGRMGLDPHRPVTAGLTGDGSLRLRLTGWTGAAPTARLDGEAVKVRRGRGSITLDLDLPAGIPHMLKLR
jgi:hypothetical protein